MPKKKTMIEGFWDRFEECLIETGENRVAIAEKIGCNRKVLYNDYENRSVSISYIINFCMTYGYSSDYLFGISKQKENAIDEAARKNLFWDRFYECAEETGDAKTVIAKRIGCERKTLYKSSEEKLPSPLYIARFCTTYGFTSDYLLGISKEKYNKPKKAEQTNEPKIVLSEWQPIPGYEGTYEASLKGQVRRICKDKQPRLMSSYEKKPKNGSRYLVVKLTQNGKSKEIKTSKLVYEAYNGTVPEGYSVVHKDGDFNNNELDNLIILTKEELGKQTGHKSKSRSVIKYSDKLVPIERYRSAREAAASNYMSYQTVMDRCNGKVKSFLAPDGCVYRWDETIAI